GRKTPLAVRALVIATAWPPSQPLRPPAPARRVAAVRRFLPAPGGHCPPAYCRRASPDARVPALPSPLGPLDQGDQEEPTGRWLERASVHQRAAWRDFPGNAAGRKCWRPTAADRGP